MLDRLAVLTDLSLIVGVFTLVVVLRIYSKVKELNTMFADDVKAALATQTTSITAAQARAAAGVVSPADQATILGTINSNTAAIDQIAPAATPQP